MEIIRYGVPSRLIRCRASSAVRSEVQQAIVISRMTPSSARGAGAPRNLRAHLALDAVFGQFLLELRVHPLVLILELDLGAAELDAHVRVILAALARVGQAAVLAAVKTQRKVPGGRRAGVEVLVEPLLGRNEEAAVVPVDPLRLAVPVLPQVGVAGAADDEHVRPRAVPVRLLVR